jgi:hypothetical protein
MAYFSQVPRATRHASPHNIASTACLQKVTVADSMLHDELESSWLSNTCNKMEARCKGAQKVSKQDHGCRLDEVSRMEILEYDFANPKKASL